MIFKAKNMRIATGSVLVATLNKYDAEKLDLHPLDRIKITKGKKTETVVVDIAESNRTVPKGYIGLFEEVEKILKTKNGNKIKICFARKPLSLDFIKKKLDGGILTKKEIDQIVWDIVNNKISEVELTYFVSACYTHSMSVNETILLTKSMAEQGSLLKLKNKMVIDKHSIGGIPGNRTTMIVVPIVAAAGLMIPKTSSRSITSPAGTADTMEVLANVCFPINRMKKIVEKTNGCIVWGGALNLAPADDKIIRVERPLSIDAESQLIASIFAKKLSVSSTHILIDIPLGKGAKLENLKKALRLKKEFESIGKKLRKKIKVIITDGKQPIGNGIGPALEARDVLWLLKNDKRAPQDLKNKSVMMAGIILEMAGKAKKGNGRKMALEILESGKAYKKMVEIIKLQGKRCIEPGRIKTGKFSCNILANKPGKVKFIDNKIISKVARLAGAPADKGAGIYLYKHIGDNAKKGEKIYTIYSDSREKLDYAKSVVEENRGCFLD